MNINLTKINPVFKGQCGIKDKDNCADKISKLPLKTRKDIVATLNGLAIALEKTTPDDFNSEISLNRTNSDGMVFTSFAKQDKDEQNFDLPPFQIEADKKANIFTLASNVLKCFNLGEIDRSRIEIPEISDNQVETKQAILDTLA